MKKILLSILVGYVGLFASNVFADTLPSSVSIQSISDALSQRKTFLGKHSVGVNAMSSATAVGNDTYIVIVNYTDTTIQVSVEGQLSTLTRQTAERYQRPNYMGQTRLTLANASGAVFFNPIGGVGYQDIVSVYLSNGSYVAYDTH